MAETELKLHNLLTLIEVENYPKERVEQLWEKVRAQEYAFDDTLKDNPNLFISHLIMPNNLFFEIGELGGLACVTGIMPKVACTLHFLTWERYSISQLRAAGKSLIENLFTSYELSRISSFIPEMNTPAMRLAVSLGFVWEGSMRDAFLHNGLYQNLHIYGLVKEDFARVKGY